MENQIENLISKTIKDLSQRIGFNFDNLNVEKKIGPEEQEMFIVRIKSDDDCSSLLDDKGKSLRAFEYIARMLVIKESNQKINLIIDLNDFLEKRNSRISELARLVAKRVETTQKSFVLRPMSAYERRLVHLELATLPGVITESIGEEPKRRVVIKPGP